MRFVSVILLFLLSGSVRAQNPWKNIYSQHAWEERDKWQKTDALVRLLGIGSGSAVADVGCHEGYMTFKLAPVVGQKGVVYAVDVMPAKLEKVNEFAEKNNLTQVKTIKGDYNDPKLPSNSLDAVIILDTYHEMDDHVEILRHIMAALKPGGRLLVCDPIADARRNLPRSDQEKKHELAMKYALTDLKKAGFRIIFQEDNFIDRSREKGDKMWVIVAEKAPAN